MALRTNYVDDVLDTNVNTTRVFDILDSNNNVVEQDVHFDDKTTYTQNGSSFGSADMNATNTAVNSHESNFAPIESDATSSANAYSVGDHLVLNNVYYEVISAIAVNDALTVGTNIQQANIGDEITQLNTELTWINAGEEFGGTIITIPDTWDELLINVNSNDQYQNMVFYILRQQYGSASSLSYRIAGGPDTYATIVVSSTSVDMNLSVVGGTDLTTSRKFKVSYR